MGHRVAFTVRERRRMCNTRYGHRPTNDWGDGDLPCPWAEGDIVDVGPNCPALHPDSDDNGRWVNDPETGRAVAADLSGVLPPGYRPGYRRLPWAPGLYVVSYCPSIGEGDDWYVRLRDADMGYCDRLHVFDGGRGGVMNYMADTRIVDTADPDGLALRERMLADGWTFEAAKAAAGPCDCCGCPTRGIHP